jgi:ribosomal protein L32
MYAHLDLGYRRARNHPTSTKLLDHRLNSPIIVSSQKLGQKRARNVVDMINLEKGPSGAVYRGHSVCIVEGNYTHSQI